MTTRLFPNLRFGCNGTIVRMIVAVMNRRGSGVPKIQTWRESKDHRGVYYKPGPDIPIIDDSSVCVRHRRSDRIFRCTLNETFQVSVQPGDILGLELPPENDEDFDIYLKSGGPMPLNYVFEGKLNSTVNISEADYPSYDLPQIKLVVILGVLQNQSMYGDQHLVIIIIFSMVNSS